MQEEKTRLSAASWRCKDPWELHNPLNDVGLSIIVPLELFLAAYPSPTRSPPATTLWFSTDGGAATPEHRRPLSRYVFNVCRPGYGMHAVVAGGEVEALCSFLEVGNLALFISKTLFLFISILCYLLTLFGDKEDDCLIRYLFYLFNCTMLCSMWR